MAATYEPIATTTLSSAASSISFTGIANSWTDLRLVFKFVGAGNTLFSMRFNGDSGSNYSTTILAGDGTSATSSRYTNRDNIGNANGFVQANIPGLLTADIFNYAGSTYKSVLVEKSYYSNSTFSLIYREVALWRSTSAITSISLTGNINFEAGTSATIYGIKAA